MDDRTCTLDSFNGVARLFPLPNLVLFPHAVQPLHIFETRYRQMTADALAGDRLIAPVLLRDGWEHDYDFAPAIHTVACLGKIVAEKRLADGRYNLLLRGVSRVRIDGEICADKLYRSAAVSVLADVVSEDMDELSALRRRLAEILKPRPGDGSLGRQLEELFHSDLPLAVVGNIIAFSVPLPIRVKQELLEIDSVVRRVSELIVHLERLFADAGVSKESPEGFPPAFSPN